MVRTILCYGDSNTWGYSPENGERLAPGERWPGVLGARLGASARVVEEGLNGRTSVFDVPGEPILNGRPFLPVCLASQAPIDVVVIYLGTNDVWLPSVSAIDAAVGVGELAGIVAESESGPGSAAPGVLVVVPPPFAETADDEPGARRGPGGVPPVLRGVRGDGRRPRPRPARPARRGRVEPARRRPLRRGKPPGYRRGRGGGAL